MGPGEMPDFNPNFKPLKDGWGVQPIGPSPLGGDIHDTFHVDNLGNINGGHTTVQLPGYDNLNVPW